MTLSTAEQVEMKRNNEVVQASRTALLVDGHVHFHPCFSWSAFLDAVEENFARARRSLGSGDHVECCLLMTENARDRAFLDLRDGQVDLPGRDIQPGDETDSVSIISPSNDRLHIIAGRQVISSDGLEVLAIGYEGDIPDGRETSVTIELVREQGAVPVLPWGFGKWTGRRGRIVREILRQSIDDESSRPLLLGDNGNRLRLSARPAFFNEAEEAGIAIIPGSDPLPIPAHAHRVGAYGFLLDDWTDDVPPAEAIRRRLRALDRSPQTFGRLASLPQFLRDQFLMQWRKRHASRSMPTGP